MNFRSIPDVYTDKLVSDGVLSRDDVNQINSEYTKYLQAEYEAAGSYKPEVRYT